MKLLQGIVLLFIPLLLSCDFRFGASPQIKYRSVTFQDGGEEVFLSARVWGLTGDHEEVRACSRQFSIDVEDPTNECLILYTDHIYYRWIGKRQLSVYAYTSALPAEYPTRVGDIQLSIHGLEKVSDEYSLKTRGYQIFDSS
jgi:hypothetical protein